MNLSDDLKHLCRSYIKKSIQRAHCPSVEQIISNLEIEFGKDWQILLPKDLLINWYEKIEHLQFIQYDSTIEEILIHSAKTITYIYANSRKSTECGISQQDLELSLELLCIKERIDWNENSPFVSFKYRIGNQDIRISLTHKSLSCEHSHKASIRFHTKESYPISSYFSSLKVQNIVINLFKNRKNILISGSTGSGKTSFISTLLSEADKEEHLIIIEDTHELISPNQCSTRLLSGPQNGHSLNDYCNYSLRLRPDRVIVGEIRSHECIPFILNANNGHKGLIGSIHANSAAKVPQRLSTLLCLYSKMNGINNDIALELIASGIDIIIHMEDKKVVEVIKLLNVECGVTHYEDLLESNHEYGQQLSSFSA
ncbi:CpaF/VirB11 family protein [Halobacteriovorax sp. HLS]|uniref:CpaF/VirB11 family protein n=1 Tax=Halobacteriovorax sp. HLS TaxID=2234000 RepID=UPI000FDC884C|nr:CpaF/VirB11 family protein [Halobacteriovorax sp. HLS]